MIDSYITVSHRSCEETVINKSRFIGYAAPCPTETDALSFLREIREEHRAATHHCYAYIIGENSGIMRYSDDGEPGGTAGLPILEVIKGKNIVNCCVVVVRYFGGVLLGTGGLVRAYTQGAQLAVGAAGVSRMEMTCVETCRLPYASWDRFRYAAEHQPVQIGRIVYEDAVCFDLLVREADLEKIVSALQEASGRKLEISTREKAFLPWQI